MKKKNKFSKNLIFFTILFIACMAAISYTAYIRSYCEPDFMTAINNMYQRIAYYQSKIAGYVKWNNIDSLILYASVLRFGCVEMAGIMYTLLPVIMAYILGAVVAVTYEHGYSESKSTAALFIYTITMLPMAGTIWQWGMHRYEVIVFLLGLMILQQYIYGKKDRNHLLISGILFAVLFLYFYSACSFLVLLYVLAPIILYGVIYMLQNGRYIRSLFAAASVVCVLFLFLVAIGKGSWEYTGWGGKNYQAWTPFALIWNNLLEALQYISVYMGVGGADATLIQAQSFLFLIKLLLFLASILTLIIVWIRILRNGITETDTLQVICAFCATSNILVNVISYSLYSDNSRYFSGAQFALVLLLSREGADIWNRSFIQKGIIAKVDNILVCVICISLILSICLSTPRFQYITDTENAVIDKLAENGYRYGTGDFATWTYRPQEIGEGRFEVIPSTLRGYGDIEYAFIENYLAAYGDCPIHYIMDFPTDLWVFDNIVSVYGEPVWVIQDQDNYAYGYDCDVRYAPIRINGNGEFITERANIEDHMVAPSQKIQYHFVLPVGRYRITPYGETIEDVDIAFTINGVEYAPERESMEYGDGYAIIVDAISDITVSVLNPTEYEKSFAYLEIATEYAAYDIEQRFEIESSGSERRINIPSEGNYTLSIMGEDVDDLELELLFDDIVVAPRNIIRGKKQIRSTYEIKGKGTYTMKIRNKGGRSVAVDHISYETEYEERQNLYRENYLGGID